MKRTVILVSLSLFLGVPFRGSAGTAVPTRGREWKVVCGSTEGIEGRALELLTAEMGPILLRAGDYYTSHVLPIEKEGAATVPRRHRFVLGTFRGSAAVRAVLKEGDVPSGGYFVKAFADHGTNVVVIAGDRPVDVLYGTVDFIEDGLSALCGKSGDGLRYRFAPFEGGPIGSYESRRVPQTAVRSLFTWGHVIDDYQLFFREMARLKLNRVILWNDFPPINADSVVTCAHSWGIEVFWGFPWGWDTDCSQSGLVDQDGLAEKVFLSWRDTWRSVPGDGIYFQTFTEVAGKEMAGESVAVRAVRLVNRVAERIFAVEPNLKIVFGLHAESVCDDLATIAKVDSRLEILWENCGGFPHRWSARTRAEDDAAFVDRILAETSNAAFAIKCQLLQDWNHWEHQGGPYLLGCAGPSVLARDRQIVSPLLEIYAARWMAEGERAYAAVRRMRSGPVVPKELNTVVEHNPPFDVPTVMTAELLWSTEEPYETIRDRVLSRTKGKN